MMCIDVAEASASIEASCGSHGLEPSNHLDMKISVSFASLRGRDGFLCTGEVDGEMLNRGDL